MSQCIVRHKPLWNASTSMIHTKEKQAAVKNAFLSGDDDDVGLFCVSQQVVVDTAQIENKEAYAPQITLEGSRVVVQVPSTW